MIKAMNELIETQSAKDNSFIQVKLQVVVFAASLMIYY
jgi:hypothetical protein